MTSLLHVIAGAIGAIAATLWSVVIVAWWYIAAWAIIVLICWAVKAERFGVSGLPTYLMYRTTRLNKWIAAIAEYKPTAWRTIWNIGIVTGFGSMGYIFYQLSKNLAFLFVKPQQATSVQLIVPIPGLFISFQTFPYVALALSVLLVSHELSHGIASLADHIPLKSTGVFYAHILMGGFVEPDEEKLNNARNVSKLRVFAAGSFTNIVLGFMFVVLLVNFSATIAPFYSPGGVSIGSISSNLPANGSGLQAGDVVTRINGTQVLGLADLQSYMLAVNPGQRVLLQTQRGTFMVKTAADPSNSSHALIGIGGLTEAYNPKLPFLSRNLPQILHEAEVWIQLFLVSVGLVNMLPVPLLDGDRLLEVALDVIGVPRRKEIRKVANAAAFSLIILTFLVAGARFGFLSIFLRS